MPGTSPPRSPVPRVLALGADVQLRAQLADAASRIGAEVVESADEASARALLPNADVVLVAGAGGAPLAERLAGSVPVVLRADLADEEHARLAVHGIDVVPPSVHPTILAARLALHAHRSRRERQGAATTLLRVNEALVAGLVHDLRTPLMAINLSAEVAAARSTEDPVQQAVRRIRASTQRMARALDHLVNLTRVDADPTATAVRDVDVGELVEGVVVEYRARPGVLVDLVLQGELTARIAEGPVRDAVRRLIGLAIEHGGGERVSVRADGSTRDRIWIEVSMPRAIPTEIQERLMGPARERAGREQPGLGLGLHAVEPVVRAHAGSVVGRSKPLEGTVFEVLLPRNPHAA